MNKVLSPLFVLILLSSPVLAKESKNKARRCENLNKCVQLVSQLTGKQYLVGGELKGKIQTSKNLLLTKENADTLFSHILHENGYTRVPIKGQGVFRIINARDVRYTPTPHYYATKTTFPEMPDTADYHMLTYTFSAADFGITTEVTRSLRPFMSRYGRIIDIKSQKKIVLQDTAINIKRLYKIIRDLDVKPNSEMQEKRERSQKHRRKVELLQAQHCGPNKKKS